MIENDRIIFIARLPGRVFWPVTYGLHAANHLGWTSVAYPLAATMVVLLTLSKIAEHLVPAARLND